MVHSRYNRSQILTYFELTEKQQQDVMDTYYSEEAEAIEDTFVIFNSKLPENNAALPLSQFIRTNLHGPFKPNGNLWDGVYGTSYFSAYFIKLAKNGEEALVAERYC